jgi:sec-independent protein translocase protein TatB
MGTPPTIELGSLGMADSLILMVLALVVFGPRRLPQIGRQIGKLMYEFRKASNDFKFQMEEELRLSEEADRRKKEEEQRKQLAASQPAQESVSASPDLVKSMGSPYPDEGQYLPAASDPEPSILPPSTGETIASTRRSQLSELTEPPAENANPATAVADTGAPSPGADPNLDAAGQSKDEPTPASEAITRNG